jgi:hypothetical protein
MRRKKYLFITILFHFITIYVNGQNMSSNDSLYIRHIHSISKFLSLDSIQEQKLIQLEIIDLKSRDSIAKQKININERRNLLINHLAELNYKLKPVFTVRQWKTYTEFLEKSRQQFLNHSSSHKVKKIEFIKAD